MAVGGSFTVRNKKTPGAFVNFASGKGAGARKKSLNRALFKEAVRGLLMEAEIDEGIIGEIEGSVE